MDDQQPQNFPSAFFPAPPPFYKHFTPENFDRRNEACAGSNPEGTSVRQAATSSLDLNALPLEVRYLIPPPLPSSGLFRCFGETIDINNPLPSLSSQGIPQLYPSPPTTPSPSSQALPPSAHRATSLSHLSKSLLLNYLELISHLATNPVNWKRKIDDLQALFYNAHHLINEYRAHHARVMLVEMMEEEVAKRQAEVQGLRELGAKVEIVLKRLDDGGALDAGTEMNEAEDAAKSSTEAQSDRRVWEVLEQLG